MGCGCHIAMAVLLSALALPVEGFQSAVAPKGAARRWGAAMPAGTYGQVNLHTGRVLTALPITGWSGRGPGISFALYHNQNSGWSKIGGGVIGDASMDGGVDGGDIDPFVEIMLEEDPTPEELAVADFNGDAEVDGEDLGGLLDTLESQASGPEWRHSYMARLYVESNKVRLVRDDGTEDVFTGNLPGPFASPLGVWDTLTYHIQSQQFTLTSKHQQRARFEHDGATNEYRLLWIADASRDAQGEPTNKVTCSYNSGGPAVGKLASVTDAVGRTLWLDYSALGRLKAIRAPYYGAYQRLWQLRYETTGPTGPLSDEGAGPFRELADPMTYTIGVSYSPEWDIVLSRDKNGNATTLAYLNGRLTTITDPVPFAHQVQLLEYRSDGTTTESCHYYDRQGGLWKVAFSKSTDNLGALTNPLGNKWELSYALSGPFVHEAAQFRNPLAKTWNFAYDGPGNLYTAGDPLGHTTTSTISSRSRRRAACPRRSACSTKTPLIRPARRGSRSRRHPALPASRRRSRASAITGWTSRTARRSAASKVGCGTAWCGRSSRRVRRTQ